MDDSNPSEWNCPADISCIRYKTECFYNSPHSANWSPVTGTRKSNRLLQEAQQGEEMFLRHVQLPLKLFCLLKLSDGDQSAGIDREADAGRENERQGDTNGLTGQRNDPV